MLDQFFSSILTSSTVSAAVSLEAFLWCTLCSFGARRADRGGYIFSATPAARVFVVTLALLPAIVQVVIMLVNGNLGAGVPRYGAFSLVRFRSAGQREGNRSIFLAMAVGLATGMGYLAIAALFTVIIVLMDLLYTLFSIGEPKKTERELKITIPESLNYTDVFDDLFSRYTSKWELSQVRTANMGSLYKG